MNKPRKRKIFILAIILVTAILIVIGLILFFSQEKFGRIPSGLSLEKISISHNYREGNFNNLWPTPQVTEGVSYFHMLKEYFFNHHERLEPDTELASIKTELLSLDKKENILIWFGHSSYFLQIDGLRILVDPVFSPWASPVSFSTKAFKGTNIYSTDDIPDLDYIFITHDHWDHLDHPTMKALKSRVGKVITGLGVGQHLERWDYSPDQIIETDWNTKTELKNGFVVHTQTARHFSGRIWPFNTTLWVSYVLKTPSYNFYFGGDSGFGPHFNDLGDRFGPFDLVILENGQYDAQWKYVHMQPEEVITAFKELKGARLMPVHSGKFCISNHPWDEPLKRIAALAKDTGVALVTPMIGQPVMLDDPYQHFDAWWEID